MTNHNLLLYQIWIGWTGNLQHKCPFIAIPSWPSLVKISRVCDEQKKKNKLRFPTRSKTDISKINTIKHGPPHYSLVYQFLLIVSRIMKCDRNQLLNKKAPLCVTGCIIQCVCSEINPDLSPKDSVKIQHHDTTWRFGTPRNPTSWWWCFSKS